MPWPQIWPASIPSTIRPSQIERCSSGSAAPGGGASTTSISGRVRYGATSPSAALVKIMAQSAAVCRQYGRR
jgi:hypothetical protein